LTTGKSIGAILVFRFKREKPETKEAKWQKRAS
jgi:hypothetical protein